MTKDMFTISEAVDARVNQKELIAKSIADSLLIEENITESSDLDRLLPLTSFFREESGQFIIQSISSFKTSSAKFIHEFIHLEVEMNSNLGVESFLALPFQFFELDAQKYLVTETVLYIKEIKTLESCYNLVRGLHKQLRLGLRSPFYARMCMEMKGRSVESKVALVQERIMRYIHRFPEVFDYDLIPLMNEFMSQAKEVFSKNRMTKDLSKVILAWYYFSKKMSIKAKIRTSERRVYIKSHFCFIEELFGRKKVLSVMVGLSYLNENERLAKDHLLKACRKFIKGVIEVEGSFMKINLEGSDSKYFYIEIKKKDGVITPLEKKSFEIGFSKYLEVHIQKFTRKIFMPQNTEEVIKYTVALSKELKTPDDFAQVAVLFDSQMTDSLLFTAIVVRARAEDSISAFEIFSKGEEKRYSCKIKHVRRLGDFKEGIEISYIMKISSFMREDYSIDIYRARSKIIADLQHKFGVVRDYNGGMLEKQGDVLSVCQAALKKRGVKNSVLLENFFYALQPSEIRAIIDAKSFEAFFLSFYEVFTYKVPKDILFEEVNGNIVFIARVRSEKKKELFLTEMKSLDIPTGNLIYFSLKIQDKFYLGATLSYSDEEEKRAFTSKMSICLKLEK